MYPVAVVLQYTINTIQYNTQKTHNNAYILKTIHKTQKVQTQCTQNYKQRFNLTHKVST